MTISRHEVTAWVGTQQIDVIDASIAMDEAWSPYVQGNLTTVLNPDTLNALDPRTGARVHVYITQAYGDSDKLSELTASYNGDTIADITAEWTGQTIAAISTIYFMPFNASFSNKLSTLSSIYGGGSIADITLAWTGLIIQEVSDMYWRSYPSGIYDNYRRSFDLAVRTRTTDIVNGTVTLDLASDEALMQDYVLVSTLNYSPGSLQLRDIIKDVLAKIGDYLLPDTTNATVTTAAALWAPGQNAWDYLITMVQAAGFRLYCDERRLWHLVDDTFTQPGIAELFALGTIKNIDDVVSRDSDTWCDAVIIKYTWVNDLGATVNTYDTATVAGKYTKARFLQFQGNYPGPGAAQRILDRAIAKGIQREVKAVSNYAVQPSMPCDIYLVGKPTENAFIQAVTWNIPGDDMTIKTRQPVIT